PVVANSRVNMPTWGAPVWSASLNVFVVMLSQYLSPSPAAAWDPGGMDALLIIDATPGQFPSSPPQPLVDLIDRARGVGGVIVHVAPTALGADPDDDPAAQEQPRLRIDSVLGTRDDELVL